MKTQVFVSTVVIIMAFAASGAMAGWSASVPVTELNTQYIEGTTFLSNDGLTLYFSRMDTNQFYYHRIYQGTRTTPSGPFTQISEISTLNNSSGHISSPWVSPDNLRMYYDTTQTGTWKIRYTSRTSVTSPWLPGTEVSQIDALGVVSSISLSSDECTALIATFNNSTWATYIATRPDRNSSFGNITPVAAMNNPASADPFLMPDGLSAYYGYNAQLYRVTRATTKDVFGNATLIPGFDHVRFATLSADGMTLYWAKEYYDPNNKLISDIYVSHYIPEPPAAQIYHVDVASGNNSNNGLTKETAFKTIQKGIQTAADGDSVLVWPGVYTEQINFLGKAITVKSAADAAILQAPGNFAVSFYTAEEPNSVLQNFVIRNSDAGVFVVNASPTIKNLTIINNDSGIESYGSSDPDISNCIFSNNTDGDLFQCEARHSYIQEDVETGMVAHWKFDETTGTIAYDSAGTNNGTIDGAQWKDGKIGGALDFDGIDDKVIVPDNDALTPANAMTLSYWMYNRGGVDSGIFKWASCSGDPGSPGISRSYVLMVFYATGMVHFRVDSFSPNYSYDALNSTGSISLNQWHLITATFDRGAAKLYIDGQLDSSKTMTITSILNDVQPLTIGGSWEYCGTDGWERPFNGRIDDVRIYNQAVDAQKIGQIYQTGLAGVYGEPLFADANNGDYHLKSERGRYWPAQNVWVLDAVSSPCIDGGDPNDDPMGEPMPNGGRIDMGAYGGTAYASMSEWRIKGDVNRDGIFDLADFAILAGQWMEKEAWKD
jgi:parallel beta-helix repeat protein